MVKNFLKLFFISLLLFAIVSCDDDDSDDIITPPPVENSTFTSENIKEGHVFFNFATEEGVQVLNTDWDLKFEDVHRSPEFFLNPDSLTAHGYAMIYNSGELDLAAVTTIDPDLYTTDPDTTITGDNWYVYDMGSHTLTTKGFVYVFKGVDGTQVKFRLDDYDIGVFMLSYAVYDEGTSTFGDVQSIEVYVSQGKALFSFSGGTLTPTTWDIEMGIILLIEGAPFPMKMPSILQSRNGMVGIKIFEDQEFDDVDPITLADDDFEMDTATDFVIGDQWFDYDGETHRVTSKGHIYAIKTTDGQRGKFKILSYYHEETNVSGHMKIEYLMIEE